MEHNNFPSKLSKVWCLFLSHVLSWRGCILCYSMRVSFYIIEGYKVSCSKCVQTRFSEVWLLDCTESKVIKGNPPPTRYLARVFTSGGECEDHQKFRTWGSSYFHVFQRSSCTLILVCWLNINLSSRRAILTMDYRWIWWCSGSQWRWLKVVEWNLIILIIRVTTMCHVIHDNNHYIIR